jgi:catechol 2,3-dioxygenase-like lactoylglutathione lyase family enzyme
MMRPQPLICVRDVEASSRWYQRLLNCQSAHGGPNYERLVFSSELVLQLHRWEEEHHHGRIGDPNDLPPGNGLLLWFEVDDIDAAIARAEAMSALVSGRPDSRNASKSKPASIPSSSSAAAPFYTAGSAFLTAGSATGG